MICSDDVLIVEAHPGDGDTAAPARISGEFVGLSGGPLEAQIGPITNAHQQQLITAEFRHGQLVIDSPNEVTQKRDSTRSFESDESLVARRSIQKGGR